MTEKSGPGRRNNRRPIRLVCPGCGREVRALTAEIRQVKGAKEIHRLRECPECHYKWPTVELNMATYSQTPEHYTEIKSLIEDLRAGLKR